jgi:hypothetical protein
MIAGTIDQIELGNGMTRKQFCTKSSKLNGSTSTEHVDKMKPDPKSYS